MQLRRINVKKIDRNNDPIQIISELLYIDVYPIDNMKNPIPYLPHDEKWIPNLKTILKTIPLHDANGIWFEKTQVEFFKQIWGVRKY